MRARYSSRCTIRACAFFTSSMLRENRTTNDSCISSVRGGRVTPTSRSLACAKNMKLPAMPFSASSWLPLPKINLRQTGRPKQLSRRAPVVALLQSGCSRPNHRRLASAGGGILMSFSWRHRLEMQILQHQTVASMSPTPAQRESKVFDTPASTGFASLLRRVASFS